ncbi:MAG TPA: DUF805 domain-containing protein [Rhizomicrobium sp.]|nr:DUF805 domain-containing protein [Rhizomicrobium sp.]
MTFKNAITSCYQTNYVGFTGRASRSEYWFFVLSYVLLTMVVAAVCALLGGSILLWIGIGIVMLGVFLPSLAAQVRRLHDTNASGWWILIGLIPYIGGLIMLVWYCIPGTKGENRFGPDPLQQDVAEVFT